MIGRTKQAKDRERSIMTKGRLEAFSDGVLAIIITIMVLEMKVHDGGDLSALRPIAPVFASYALSFVYLGIYWNNHHHLLQATQHVNGAVLWANLHLLFWLSLVPFVTHWMGRNNFATVPVALYGVVLWCAGFAFYLLSRALVTLHGRESALGKALGQDWKGIASLAIYLAAIPLAFVSTALSCVLFVVVAALWLIPDRRIERTLTQ